MNEFEKLEAELKELRPLPPSEEFTARLETALGDAGKVAMCCLPEDEDNEQAVSPPSHVTDAHKLISFPRLALYAGLVSGGLAAVWAGVFYLSGLIAPDGPGIEPGMEDAPLVVQNPMPVRPLMRLDDPDSPLHGLSLDQIQDVSVMPVSGWLDPQINERFLRMVDEGVYQQPGGLPARRVRHFFMDETLWSHPASDTRILSTTPREEVFLIELETY